MKFTAFAFAGLLATGVVASPGGYGSGSGSGSSYCKKGQKVEWTPGLCKSCPYTRDANAEELFERGGESYGYGVCKRQCPADKKKCLRTDWAKGSPVYYGSSSTTIDCKKASDYSVSATVGPCGYGSKSECLIVKYGAEKGHSVGYLGVYGSKSGSPTDYKKLNYNWACKGDTCTVPLEKLGGYGSKLCDKTLYIGVDNSRCPVYRPPPPKPHYGDQGKYGKYGRDVEERDVEVEERDATDLEARGGYSKPVNDVTYFPITIKCKGTKECKEWCCCPAKKDWYGSY